MTKYKLTVIIADKNGIIDLPPGAIPIGEPKVSNYYSTNDATISALSTIKAWVPV